MTDTELITGVGELNTHDESGERLHDAALVIGDGRILWIGPAAQAPAADRRTDVAGRAVLSGWVDTHTHLVFGGERSAEFEARMAGQAYAAGGINTTVAATRAATEEQLVSTAQQLRHEAETQGTTFLETKTGYGLNVASEARSARAAARVADVVTFLGAHIVPAELDRRDYLDLVTGPMLAAVLPYVQFIDAFCEHGAFDVEETREVLLAGRAARRRAWRAQRRPLQPPRAGRHRRPGCIDHGGHPAAGLRPVDPAAFSPGPATARRRSDDCPGDQLQSGHLVHDVDAILCGDHRSADGSDRG